MNSTEQTLLALLRCALHAQSYDDCADTDWSAVLKEANAQTVTALAASALPPTLPETEWKAWEKAKYVSLSIYMRNLHAQDELCRIFSENRIPMVILKGSAAAIYYPQPSLRAMGDIDFVVPKKWLEQSHELLMKNGYTQISESNGRHEEWEKNNVELELHFRFSHDIDIEELIEQGMQEIVLDSIDGHSFPRLPKLANGIVLLDHMRAHLRSGLGLRQLIDWMMYVERELDDAFWKESFSTVAKEKSMYILAVTATRACQIYLGLPESIHWCREADEELCDIMMENLLRSGNFGRKNGAGNNVEKVSASIRRNGFFHNLQIAGEYNWRALRKHPDLRKFAWLYQLFRYSSQILRIKRGKKAVDDLRRGKERNEMLKRLGIK